MHPHPLAGLQLQPVAILACPGSGLGSGSGKRGKRRLPAGQHPHHQPPGQIQPLPRFAHRFGQGPALGQGGRGPQRQRGPAQRLQQIELPFGLPGLTPQHRHGGAGRQRQPYRQGVAPNRGRGRGRGGAPQRGRVPQ